MTTKNVVAGYKRYYETELSTVRWATNGQGKATCPFHDDNEPSLSIDAATGKFFCHGCEAKGSIVSFHMRRHDLEQDEAKQVLAQMGLLREGTRVIAATYDYVNKLGELLYQAVRYEPKRFSQRRPDGHGGWINDLHGVERVLYNLPEVSTPFFFVPFLPE